MAPEDFSPRQDSKMSKMGPPILPTEWLSLQAQKVGGPNLAPGGLDLYAQIA